MITFVVVSGHLLFNAVFGWALLSLYRNDRNWAETLLLSVLLGMYVETLLVASMMFLGLSLAAAGIGTALIMAGLAIVAFYRHAPYEPPSGLSRPHWYECLLLVTIGEKVLFALWQLARTHTYFDDTLRHWSGRARSLFAEVNWSMDPESPFFLGGHIGSRGYPLETVLWRALTAKIRGEWNDVISRADGLIFFVVILGAIWLAVWRFSKVRWIAAAATFIVAAVPLHAWHAAAGYNDIAVEAFVLLSLTALLRSEWLPAGLMAAGAVWSKNDALFLYFPALLTATVLLQIRPETRSTKYRNVGQFLSGFITIAPWLIFNYSHGLGIIYAAPGQGGLFWRSGAAALLWSAMIQSPTSSILWIGVFSCAVYTCITLFKDRTGRAMLSSLVIVFLGIAFVFTSTSAYDFLADQTTIHRVMMQLSSMAVLVMTYGLWLKTRQAEWYKVPARVRAAKRR